MRLAFFLICCSTSAFAAARVPDPAPDLAVVRWPQPVGFGTARSFAIALGGELASIPDARANGLLTCLRNLDEIGLDPCDGPWIGLGRPAAALPGAAWRWTDLSAADFTRWAEGCPSTSVRIEAAAALLPDGGWIDSIPSVDAGAEIRAAAILWPPSSDGNGDGVPDALAASRIPTIVVPPSVCGADPADLDGSGRIDSGDLAIVLAGWGTSQDLPDIDDDGIVGPLDLGSVLAAWTGD